MKRVGHLTKPIQLKKWLSVESTNISQFIAGRAAMRVLPFVCASVDWGDISKSQKAEIILSAFRANFLTWAVYLFPSVGKFGSARRASNDASRAVARARSKAFYVGAAGFSAFRAAAAAVRTVNADRINAAKYAVDAVDAAIQVFPKSRKADITAGASGEIWDLILDDMRVAGGLPDLPSSSIYPSLWLGAEQSSNDVNGIPPRWAVDPWNRFAGSELADEFGFGEWVSWFSGVLYSFTLSPTELSILQNVTVKMVAQTDRWWRRDVSDVNRDISRWFSEARDVNRFGKGTISMINPLRNRTFVRLPEKLADSFNVAALKASTPELFQRVLTLGHGDESAALLAQQTSTETHVGWMLSQNSMVVESEEVADFLARRGALLYPDFYFQILDEHAVPDNPKCRYWEPNDGNSLMESAPGSLKDVLVHINADAVRQLTNGEGATIAIIDTGVHENLAEIGGNRRLRWFNPDTYHADRHWVDRQGHGSMCAVIAAGSKDPGLFDGVAPGSSVISCRTDFSAADISALYLNLISIKQNKQISGPLIVNNSYGLYTCQSPGVMPADHPFMDAINLAIDQGITVVFAAGNNHHDIACNHPPDADGPNTIWGPNSHDRVLSVGTVNRNNSNQDPSTPHVNSSRGPGEWADKHPKPDCVAPTYGIVKWANEPKSMAWWGTSGAAPQAAGLAALIQSYAVQSLGGPFQPDEVNDIIRTSCRPLPAPRSCVGRGLIDCAAALAEARKRRQEG